MRKTLPTLIIATAALLFAGNAWASHPERGQMERVKVIAHELDDAARHVHKLAERRAHHYGWGERRALAALHDLEYKARHFHRQVERYYQDPYHTERDFEALYRSYRRASRAFRYLHAGGRVYEYFHDVQTLMGDLMRYYGYERGYGYRGHGRYDRDPYCEYDHDHRGHRRHHGGRWK